MQRNRTFSVADLVPIFLFSLVKDHEELTKTIIALTKHHNTRNLKTTALSSKFKFLDQEHICFLEIRKKDGSVYKTNRQQLRLLRKHFINELTKKHPFIS